MTKPDYRSMLLRQCLHRLRAGKEHSLIAALGPAFKLLQEYQMSRESVTQILVNSWRRYRALKRLMAEIKTTLGGTYKLSDWQIRARIQPATTLEELRQDYIEWVDYLLGDGDYSERFPI